jgi:enoyl-CoA hydratase
MTQKKSYENILVEVRGPIAVVTLNRPRVLNALNAATFRDLGATFDELVANTSVRAILLTGSGEKAFAAGADIQELAQLSAVEGQALALRGQHLFDRIESCGKPVIACINGFALGGGCELALACTFRIASETAKLGQPEVKLGLIPGYGGSQRLPRLIGKGAALRLLLTGEIIPALEALRLGLVEEVVVPDQLLSRAEQIAQAIAAQAPLAVEKCLEAVHAGYDLPLRQALDLEAALFALCCSTEDKAEGTQAFLEKRPAVWKGR